MFKTLVARARQGYRTAAYPAEQPYLPRLFRGRPVFEPAKCLSGCAECAKLCPTEAIRISEFGPRLDLGRCIFCGECASACPGDAVAFTRDWRLAASDRNELFLTGSHQPRSMPSVASCGGCS